MYRSIVIKTHLLQATKVWSDEESNNPTLNFLKMEPIQQQYFDLDWQEFFGGDRPLASQIYISKNKRFTTHSLDQGKPLPPPLLVQRG